MLTLGPVAYCASTKEPCYAEGVGQLFRRTVDDFDAADEAGASQRYREDVFERIATLKSAASLDVARSITGALFQLAIVPSLMDQAVHSGGWRSSMESDPDAALDPPEESIRLEREVYRLVWSALTAIAGAHGIDKRDYAGDFFVSVDPFNETVVRHGKSQLGPSQARKARGDRAQRRACTASGVGRASLGGRSGGAIPAARHSPPASNSSTEAAKTALATATAAVIHTDGGCEPNPGRGGWGTTIDVVRMETVSLWGGVDDTTNYRMEMTAAIVALSVLPVGWGATIFSDSQYLVKGMTQWLSGWKQKGFRRGDALIPNADLWRTSKRSAAGGRSSGAGAKATTGMPAMSGWTGWLHLGCERLVAESAFGPSCAIPSDWSMGRRGTG